MVLSGPGGLVSGEQPAGELTFPEVKWCLFQACMCLVFWGVTMLWSVWFLSVQNGAAGGPTETSFKDRCGSPDHTLKTTGTDPQDSSGETNRLSRAFSGAEM